MYTMPYVSILEGYIYICYGQLYLYDICICAMIYKALLVVTAYPTCTASGYMTGKSKYIGKPTSD